MTGGEADDPEVADSNTMDQVTEQEGPALASAGARARSGAPLAGRSPGAQWAIGGAAFLFLGAVVARWANTRPGFDPFGWLVWGHQALIGRLDTNAAPSWKPLPFLFTLPYALAGHFQLWLWMITSVAISLSAMAFAARIAYQVTDAPPMRRWAAVVAAVFAAVGLNLITQQSPQYSIWHYILSDQSDPMIVALCLGAIDCHLNGRYRWAFVLGALAGLGRPEVWALLGPYWIWLWVRQPRMRLMLVGSVVVMAFLWFGIPAISSRSAFVSADNAFYSGRRLKSNQIFGTISRFLDLLPRSIELAALLSVGIAAWRRDHVTLALTGIVVVWMLVEIAMVLHGWPGVPRYMFEPAAVTVVIAAIGLGRLLELPTRISEPLGITSLVLVAAVCAGLIPAAVSAARAEHSDLDQQRLRTRTLNLLSTEIAGYGGAARFHGCGEPLTRLQYQSSVAWNLNRNVSGIGFKYGPAIASGRPIVLFTPYPQAGSGWQIQALHQRTTRCRSLPS